uniref:Uncharacterized protein n=1 Tax=viral metagenome TaxID=1070528 RepID=A0A6C0HZA5_9ZZZZ
MHETLDLFIKAFIDNITRTDENDDITYTGWCFHTIYNILPLRVKSETQTIYDVNTFEKSSVGQFYNIIGDTILNCGWSVKIPNMGSTDNYYLEMNVHGQWTSVFNLSESMVPIEMYKQPKMYDSKMVQINNNVIPSYVVVDNFYKEPNALREYALSQHFEENIQYHKGKRCLNPMFRFPGLKERFEQILDKKIKNWDYYSTNGCFQYCVAEDKSVYHCDAQEYAGMIYLSPDAPPDSGTRLYRSKYTKKMLVPEEDFNVVFKNGFYDSTEFEQVDVVGNVFNRLILFNARMIHAAPVYFGNTKENSRLFQLFFFDIEN